MAMKNPYQKYSNESLYTATPEELTLKLYEGALKFCNQGIVALENKDYEMANELMIKVQNIIREFQITLNMEYEISSQFASLYEYMYRRTVEANMGKNIEILAEVRDLMRSFRDMWKSAMVEARKQRV